MIVYHVTTKKKFLKYILNGKIKHPVRAWESIDEAERFSKSTGRRIILKLNFPANAERLPGHKNKAYWLPYTDYIIENMWYNKNTKQNLYIIKLNTIL